LTTVEDLAAYFAAQIRAVQSSGPYVIAGYCAGGTIAFELARQLQQAGAEIKTLGLFGSPFPTSYRLLPKWRHQFGQVVERTIRHAGAITSLSRAELRTYVMERWNNLKAKRTAERNAKPDPVLVWREKVGKATLSAIRGYTPQSFSGRMSLFWPNQQWRFARNALARWSALANEAEKYFGPEGCDGGTMLQEPHAAAFASLLESALLTTPERATSVARRAVVPPVHPQSGRMEAFSH
jgi:thioesterase domain-containing protein